MMGRNKFLVNITRADRFLFEYIWQRDKRSHLMVRKLHV